MIIYFQTPFQITLGRLNITVWVKSFLKNKQYASAEKAYKSAIEIDPIFSFAWDNLGLTYRWQEKFDLALEAYNNSLMLEPNGFMPLQNIPIVYELMEEYDRAL